MQPFTEKVIRVVGAIPEGKVMTYGSVAAAAGSPRAARQVVRILHSMGEKYGLPWHRVVNAAGSVSLPGDAGELQRALLAAEGIEEGLRGAIDLERHRHDADGEAIDGERHRHDADGEQSGGEAGH
ncbi:MULTISPECIES: MGMT family protein [unclassified Paenibacillus]|uniref:MGMT family protein n=1 Tax=unclassified Paenibacillus TaxID=185978 RepID=UPI0009556AD4|nr:MULTISPECIES: MGMT family protein [unclassified Paenibacillus]ASS65524.1 DNA methyltransferase [Paenibacillus sp. RUD330]SIQ33250.1 methylated-DNA-protein-cysteine methyltransferase related protein [Paenibacillus sp. RU4X]SIQ54882.1 methylated-DNA-protein-cysteine methyltransferase related protein [Paenibacillus sp. RU4T]